MRQLLIAALVLSFVTWVVPDLRERAAEPMARGLDRAWTHLEGPLAPVLDPYRTIQTNARLGQITTELVGHRNRGRPAPDDTELHRFLQQRDLGDAFFDGWGQPVMLELLEDSVRVRSSGPDLTPETEDDLVSAIRYPYIRRGPARRSSRR